jgi:hypothetical protein
VVSVYEMALPLQALRRSARWISTRATGAAAAGVTTAYLYKEPALRDRIVRLRQEQANPGQRLASLRERTQEGSSVLLPAKERRIHELEARVKQLVSEITTCRGQLYDSL